MHEEETTRTIPWLKPVLIAVFGATAVLITWAAMNARPYYFRDPARLGSTDAYDKLMDETLSHVPDFDGVLDSIVIETNESEIKLTMPVYSRHRDWSANARFDYHRMKPDQAFESEEGRLWMEYLAVVYGEFPEDKIDEHSVRLPARFFDTELNEFTDGQAAGLEEHKWEYSFEFEGLYPALRLAFMSDFPEGGRVLGFHAFDARTRTEISSGFSWSFPLNRRGKVTADLSVWHQTPIEFVVDIALGEPQVFEFPAEVGAHLVHPEGEVRLLLKGTGMGSRRSTRNGSTQTMVLRAASGVFGRDQASLHFVSLPAVQNMPLTYELLDARGGTINTRSSSTSGIFYEQGIEGSPDEVKTVRITYHPKRKRLIFRIPEVPGLPEENRDIENLFDVRIPFVKVRYPYEFFSVVCDLTQLTGKGNSQPGGRFTEPMVFRNITVRELVDECAKLYGPTHGALIDQENLTIEFVDMSPKARLDRLIKTIKDRLR